MEKVPNSKEEDRRSDESDNGVLKRDWTEIDFLSISTPKQLKATKRQVEMELKEDGEKSEAIS